MTAEEKCLVAIERGYTCDLENGIVYGPYGKEITYINNNYISIYLNTIKKWLRVHHFVFYTKYGYIPKLIDHINMNKLDNRISNLRPGDKSLNSQNRRSKGYCFCKRDKKWISIIGIGNKKNIFLGRYDTKEEAHNAYLDAKKIYHSNV